MELTSLRNSKAFPSVKSKKYCRLASTQPEIKDGKPKIETQDFHYTESAQVTISCNVFPQERRELEVN